MKHYNKISLAVAATLFAGSLSAASFDVRHEYKHSTEQHATRVKMGDSIGNFYYSGELKFKGEKGKFLEDLKNNGWELDLGYRYKFGENNNWTLQPGMPIEGRESGMTYKPQLRLTYDLDSVEGLSLSGRYRYDIRQNIEADDQRRHRLTGNVNYRMDDWRFGFEANYYKADGYDIFDNSDTNYELNATARRHFGQWAPYIEFGDVNVDSTSDKRELRSRVGLTYSF
ncbi:oligogalacturonate-specific porin KdgM family protein [Vibrio europaeus]|uniref:N-acetylneuraminic acid outer membrane channel protein NanC n=1 Tax=Vibrio europaeus TaxID=300876 RepID=A0AAE7AU25_9VIBR|nr:oligogalacturonate-specific porin KdgM family protein [Vibrio europaeus]MDC5806449.1 oligogalacturonate-specific porin KdgM family protein [Vibrio europaeus]MDC5812752.1 oligogalacturonate-specific porin KdgM family protein [Vibrio europaeus]MDC5824064.1 oligogalacturonate-specific porin KdgM family protein [Vibrio europaeus]MDC5829819.1 oligogalacturonate-specific porin KdgM family protein [Vibrio europaeus]MDC5836674.1 oligogalacturonate-specific porin KdgM family protein [Vibrio europaeu